MRKDVILFNALAKAVNNPEAAGVFRQLAAVVPSMDKSTRQVRLA